MTLGSIRRLIHARHLGWLLALALWLPAAQWVAATHALLHLHASVSDGVDPPAHLPSSCDTCVVAATIGGAAPAPGHPAPPAPRGPDARPAAAPVLSAALAPVAGYRSRAPPALPA